ncbi:Monocopper oxidase-like protein sku5 [Asimina triloba]
MCNPPGSHQSHGLTNRTATAPRSLSVIAVPPTKAMAHGIGSKPGALWCIIAYENGVQQRRNSWQDGVYGTNCPIPPGKNFTYILQVKDQIGSFFYFPSLAFHKAAGGFGGIRILSRPRIPVPFPDPAGDYTVLIGDWYKKNHTGRVPVGTLRGVLLT